MKIAIGIVLYENYTAKYLPYFMPSLINSCFCETDILITDHSRKKDNNYLYLENNYLNKKIDKIKISYEYVGNNFGFSKAYNKLIAKAIKKNADYFLVTNPDTFYNRETIKELVKVFKEDNKIASATGKIKKWNFLENDSQGGAKTNIIDSTGLIISKEHRFLDRGQGEIDNGQHNKKEEIFGASGALAIYKLEVLKDVAYKNENKKLEYFDELMFMYKEDIDLAYRLQLAGYKSIYTPKAVIYHDRSVESRGSGIIGIIKGRFSKKKINKEWSWLNHHIILKKILDNNFSRKVRLATYWYELKGIIFIIIFEQYLIKQWWKLFKIKKEIRIRKEQIKVRVDVKTRIEKLMIDL